MNREATKTRRRATWFRVIRIGAMTLIAAMSANALAQFHKGPRDESASQIDNHTGGPGMGGKMGFNNYHAYFPWHDLEKLIRREVTAEEREPLTAAARNAGRQMKDAQEVLGAEISKITGLSKDISQRLLPLMPRPGFAQIMQRRDRFEDRVFNRMYETIERHMNKKLRSSDKRRIRKAHDEMLDAYADTMDEFSKTISDIVSVPPGKVKEIIPLV